jgi:hypothetical protein
MDAPDYTKPESECRVEPAILDSFRNMSRCNAFALGKVRDSAGYAENAVVRTSRKGKLRHRLPQQRLTRFARGAMDPRFAYPEKRVGASLSTALFVAGPLNPRTQIRAWLTLPRSRELLDREGRNLNLQIDPVRQRSRQPTAVTCNRIGCAPALARRVTKVSARAGVHRRDKLEPGRKARAPRGTTDRNLSRLQRLTQSLKYAAWILGQLVQEKDAMMGERDFSRSRVSTATNQRDR